MFLSLALCSCLCTCQEGEDSSSQDDCLKVGSAYVIVYSVTDRSSFDSASELRITLRRTRQAENLPIILVGNKSDLVRSREVAVEGRRHKSQGIHKYEYVYARNCYLVACEWCYVYNISSLFFSQRAERARWSLTVSSSRHLRRFSTTWLSSLRVWFDSSGSVVAAARRFSTDAPSTNAKRALPRRLGASWTDWWLAKTSAWRSKCVPRAATTWPFSENTAHQVRQVGLSLAHWGWLWLWCHRWCHGHWCRRRFPQRQKKSAVNRVGRQ